jgi:putative endonuclease
VPADDRQALGRAGEQLAAEHLERSGFTVLERNYRTRWGELDLVACDGMTLAFCEVKTRRLTAGRGYVLEAVGPRKQARVRRMAMSWLTSHPRRPHVPNIRFDAIGVTFDRAGRLAALEHLEGAF